MKLEVGKVNKMLNLPKQRLNSARLNACNKDLKIVKLFNIQRINMVFIAANGGLEFVRAMGEPIQKFMLLRIQTLKN